MNQNKIQYYLDYASKICAVAIAGAIPISTVATDILFPVAGILCLTAGNWRAKINFIFSNWVAVSFLLFYALFLVGVTYTSAPLHDVLVVLRKYDKLVFAAFLFPIFAEEKWRNYAINVFFISILIVLVTSYVKYFGFSHFNDKYGSIEFFKNHIAYNFIMAFAAYLCLLKIVAEKKYRLLWACFLPLIIFTMLFLSSGRSGYFVFAALIVLFFVQQFKWRGLLMAAVAVVLVFGGALSFSTVFRAAITAAINNVRSYHQNEMTSVGERITFQKNSLNLVKAHPVIGTGTGSFIHEYSKIQSATDLTTHNPHNEYLHVAVQLGGVGLIALLAFFGLQLWQSRYLPRDLGNIARGMVIGTMIGCLANSWILDTTEGHLYVFFIALAFAGLRRGVFKVEIAK